MTFALRSAVFRDFAPLAEALFKYAEGRGYDPTTLVLAVMDEASWWVGHPALADVKRALVHLAGRCRFIRYGMLSREGAVGLVSGPYPTSAHVLASRPSRRDVMVLGFDEPRGAAGFFGDPTDLGGMTLVGIADAIAEGDSPEGG